MSQSNNSNFSIFDGDLRLSEVESRAAVFYTIFNLYVIQCIDTKTLSLLVITGSQIADFSGVGIRTVSRALASLIADGLISAYELPGNSRGYSIGWEQKARFDLALSISYGMLFYFDNGYFFGCRLLVWENGLVRRKGSVRHDDLKATAYLYQAIHNEPESDSLFDETYARLKAEFS